MARSASARRSAGRRPGRLDRPAQPHVPVDTTSPPAPRPRSPGDDIHVSTPPESPAESPSSDLTPGACWTLLPAAERERFELRLSRLVLRAARIPSPDTQENT